MSRTIQFRRLGAATLANTTGANGELIINNTNKTLTVHDGVTPGGYALLNSATDNNIDQFARTTANTATNNIIVLQGVNTTQNTNITTATNLAQAAFNAANSAGGNAIDQFARNTANSKFSSSGGQITGNVTIVGNLDVTNNTVVTNAIEANNVIIDGTLLSGLAARSSVVLPHLIAQFASNSASYVQTNSQNINPEGSADWVVTADNGTDTDFYIDMGLHGSQSYDGIISPYDGYLYVQGSTIGQAGGNLIIGTTSSFPGLETMFVSGGYQYQNNIVMRVGSYGANVIGDLIVTGNITGPTITALSGGGVTGNISVTATNSQINFVPNSSGDGFGYSTIELVPDTNATQDQYLIIDPTAPSHIHIRAGGQQDASAAELYLGGEKNYVRVSSGVRLQTEELDDTYYYYSDPSQFTLGSWYEDSGTYYVQYTTTNGDMQNRTFDFTNDTINNQLNVYHSGGSSNTLTSAGSASSLGGNVYRVSVNEAPPTNPLALEAIEFRIFRNRTSFIEIQNSDVEISADDDVRIYAQDLFALYNNSTEEPIEIITNYDSNQKRWAFGADGTLTTPGDITVSGDITGTSGASTLVLKAQPNSNTSIQLNNIVDSTISTVANLTIRTDVDNTTKTWEFGTDGTLTFPDASVQTGGSISIVELKALVANCATYGDFQTAIANL